MKKSITIFTLCLCLVFPFLTLPIKAQETEDVATQSSDQIQENQQEDNNHLEDYSQMYGFDPITDEQKMVPINNKGRSTTSSNAYIAVFIEFSDLPYVRIDNPETVSVANMIMNDGGKLIGPGNVQKDIVSLKNYINKYSYGKMSLQTHFFPKDTNGVVKSYVAPNPSNYYKSNINETNPAGYGNATEQRIREQELLEGALASVKADIEKSLTPQQLDSGLDNQIDAISFFVESDPSLNDINWSDLLWSHKTNGSFNTTIAGKTVNAYNLINVSNPANPGAVFSYSKEYGTNKVFANRSSYGVIQHEFLHTLGLPDLYRGYANGTPVGYYDVMAQQIGDNPQAPTSIMRRDWLKWGKAIDSVSNSTSVTLNIPNYTDPNEKNAVKIKSPRRANEYFIVDYYKRQENQSSGVGRGDGLIIYRINETQDRGNINSGVAGKDDYMYIFRPDEEILKEAKGDLYSAVILPTVGNTYGKELDETQKDIWDNSSIYYSDGTNSGVKIKITSTTSSSITFNVIVPSVSGTGTQTDPYLLYNVQDLDMLKSHEGKYFKIMNDMNFENENFVPIDTMRNHLDGQGFTFRNVSITNAPSFFGSVYPNASIKNLKFENINVNYKGDDHVGAIASSSNGLIENVQILSGSITGTMLSNQYRGTGGIVGTAYEGSSIINSFVSASVQGGNYVGGLVGLNQGGVLKDSYANGLVANERIAIGGVIGGVYNPGGASYPLPINCAFDMNKTKQTYAQNEKNLNGVTGYKVNEKESFYLEDVPTIKINITTQPTTSFTKQVSITNARVASYNNTSDIFQILNAGYADVTQGIKVGSNYMPLTTSLEVKTRNTEIPIISITLNTYNVGLKPNSQFQLKATVLPTNTTQTVEWVSSNPSIASVDRNGLIKAIQPGNVAITARSASGKSVTCFVKVYRNPDVNYRTHIQKEGWQEYKKNGEMSGTSGKALRLEGINVYVGNNDYGGGIEYSTHIQKIGWQDFKRDNNMSGTSGQALRLEAIKIRLYGEIANEYDIYYRVHAQSVGWLDWAKNGESAGTAGLAYRLEGIQIQLVKKGSLPPGATKTPYVSSRVNYQTHIQTVGWQDYKKNGEVSGTYGKGLRLEGIKINKVDDVFGDVSYRTHVQKLGWQPFVKNGEMSGTSGQSLRLEAIEIKLSGELANKYDVYYRVHSQNFGWLGWAKNGTPAGTAGYSYRLEAIQIVFVEKGGPAPGSTENAFMQR